PATYTKGTAITNNTPSSSGGAVVSYSVSPALPTGLACSGSTGVISGTPTALSAATDYTVTATNSGGSTTDVVTITVKDVAPTSPSDGATGAARNTLLSATFNRAATASSITVNTANASCSGTLQVSGDGFATCVQMASPPIAGSGNTTFTVNPAALLSGST